VIIPITLTSLLFPYTTLFRSALNYFLDLMLLMLTGAMVKERVTKRRLLFGAFVASLIVPLSLYFPNSFLTSIVGKLLYSLLIVRSEEHTSELQSRFDIVCCLL